MDGKLADKPGDPERDGFIFDGWAEDANKNGTRDDEEFYTVTYKDGETVVDEHEYRVFSELTVKETPTNFPYTFKGWKDEATGTMYTFPEKITVTGPITLTAVWEFVLGGPGGGLGGESPELPDFSVTTCTVEFDSNGGSEVTPQTVPEGDPVGRPANPTREGYIFSGWYNGDEAWNFGTPVTGDLTLLAHWTLMPAIGGNGSANNGTSGAISSGGYVGDGATGGTTGGTTPANPEGPAVDIPDGGVPLSDVPQTGDNSQIWEFLALISGAGLVLLVLKNKKREDIAE